MSFADSNLSFELFERFLASSMASSATAFFAAVATRFGRDDAAVSFTACALPLRRFLWLLETACVGAFCAVEPGIAKDTQSDT